MKLYANAHAWVTATPRTDGRVEITALRDAEHAGWWPVRYDATWVATAEPRVWWKPGTWRNLTPAEAAERAIEAADEYARKQELAQFNLERAQAACEGLRARAEALASLEQELAS